MLLQVPHPLALFDYEVFCMLDCEPIPIHGVFTILVVVGFNGWGVAAQAEKTARHHISTIPHRSVLKNRLVGHHEFCWQWNAISGTINPP